MLRKVSHFSIFLFRMRLPTIPCWCECTSGGCKRRAKYGYRTDNVPLTCTLHRREGMKNLNIERCKADGCMKFPSWGEKHRKPTFCTSHAHPGMTAGKKKCEKCSKVASFGFPARSPRWCATHGTEEGAENTVSPRCCVDTCSAFVAHRGNMCRRKHRVK